MAHSHFSDNYHCGQVGNTLNKKKQDPGFIQDTGKNTVGLDDSPLSLYLFLWLVKGTLINGNPQICLSGRGMSA